MSTDFFKAEAAAPSYSVTYKSSAGTPLTLVEDKPLAKETLHFELISLRLMYRSQQQVIAEQARVIEELKSKLETLNSAF